MTRLSATAAREQLPKILKRAASRKRRTIISRRGKDMAAVIPIEDLQLLERLEREEEDRIDLELARAALKEVEEQGSIPLNEAMKRWGL